MYANTDTVNYTDSILYVIKKNISHVFSAIIHFQTPCIDVLALVSNGCMFQILFRSLQPICFTDVLEKSIHLSVNRSKS